MTRKRIRKLVERPSAKSLSTSELKVRAMNLYAMENKGVVEVSKALGLRRGTVAAWKDKGNWDLLRAAGKELVERRTVEMLAEKQAQLRASWVQVSDQTVQRFQQVGLDKQAAVILPESWESAGRLALDMMRFQKEILEGQATSESVKVVIRIEGQEAPIGQPLQVDAHVEPGPNGRP